MYLGASSSGSSALPLLFVILIIGAMYFLMIRPQQRRNREVQSMQAQLGAGDEVMTSSGIYGEVVEIDESDGTILLEVAPDVVMKFARGAVVRTIATAERDVDDESDVDEDEPDDETDVDETPAAESDQVTRRAAGDGATGADSVIEYRKD